MSGHNRWSKIKHQKEAMGASKGKLFTKLIRELTIAARDGGADPAANPRLRTALEAARAANMPSDTVQRAIRKGSGELEGESYEEVTYEGYGPGGVALLVECVTDNRTRTSHQVRHLFAKGGGNMAEAGAVAWMFEKKGVIDLPPGHAEDEVVEAALEAGADDVVSLGEEGFEVRTDPHGLEAVTAYLSSHGFAPGTRRVTFVAKNSVALEAERADSVIGLIERLEECEDVQNVHANLAT
jgi:YebC/PmpR family DNA-binding regulatory protein